MLQRCRLIAFAENFDGRSASLHLSMRRVTKPTTLGTSTSSTSHITIIGLNIVDPFRTAIAFLSEYLRHQCFIPHGEERRGLRRKDTERGKSKTNA
jgi:hypothetical protein